MNAGRVLRDAGLDTERLRAELAPVDPDTINIWPASRWLRRVWRPGIKAVTQGRLIFAHPDLLTGDRDRLSRTIVHELIHARQFAELGYPRFMYRYLKDYLQKRVAGLTKREAYLGNWAEMEARETTARLTSQVTG